jgi:hypothetical protein
MKSLLNKSAKYVFSILPLAAIIIIVNLKKSPDNFISTHHLSAVANKISATNAPIDVFDGLPCGFKQVGIEDAHKPTFLTNNTIPVLQYPAGNSPGTTFQISDAIYNDSQSDQLILQADGNLVIYCTSCNPVKALWSTQTNGKGGKALFFQTDGDLVLRNANNKVIWHSNIRSTCSGSELAYYTLQDDGNLAMLYDQTVGDKQVAIYLGGTATTNNQERSPHPGKIQ